MIDFINNTTDCCGNFVPNNIDNYWAGSLEVFRETITGLYNDGIKDVIFSQVESPNVNRLLDLFYLQTYLQIITQRRNQDVLNGEEKQSYEYYELYCLENIKRYFLCKGINIDPILDVWNIMPYGDEEAGIGSMAIEGTINPFTIN